MRIVWLVIGVLALIVGIIWTLQGFDIMSGSVMSGQRTFAIVGPIVGIVGIALLVFSLTGRRRANAS
jgi:hypothetical protein